MGYGKQLDDVVSTGVHPELPEGWTLREGAEEMLRSLLSKDPLRRRIAERAVQALSVALERRGTFQEMSLIEAFGLVRRARKDPDAAFDLIVRLLHEGPEGVVTIRKP